MKVFKCDHCGVRVEQTRDWDTVTFGGFQYDVCEKCSRELFKFLTPPKGFTAA